MLHGSPIHCKKPNVVIKYILSLYRLCLLSCFERNLKPRTNKKQTIKAQSLRASHFPICANCFLIPVSIFYAALINVNQIKVRKMLSALTNFEEHPCFEESVSETLIC